MDDIYTLLRHTQDIVAGLLEKAIEKDYASALATLVAAYFGAKFAFEFQREEKNKEQLGQQISRANAAILIMVRMSSVLGDYRKKFIDPVRDSLATAAIAMPASLPEDVSRERIDLSSLAFMTTAEEQQVLLDLWLEERRFHTVMQTIDRRSKLLLDHYQPLAEQRKLHERDKLTMEIVKAEIGPRLMTDLVNTTSFLVEEVDRTLASLRNATDKLLGVLRKRFPNQKFIDFEEI